MSHETTTQTRETTDSRLEDDMDGHVDKDGLANLARKLSEIYREVKAVEKTGENSYHGYSYVEEAQIVAKIRKELAERSIMLTSSTVDMRKSGKDGSLTTVEMQYTFIDGETGAQITRHWYGEGKDDQDKGAYKAYTGATKYFLLKTFLVPSGDDPESFEDIYDDDDGGESASNETTGGGPSIDEQRNSIFNAIDEVCENRESAKSLAGGVVSGVLNLEGADSFDALDPAVAQKWADSIQGMSADPRNGAPSDRRVWAVKFALSARDFTDKPDHSSGQSWQDASKRFFAVCDDLGDELTDALRAEIKRRHSVDSWKQIPHATINKWADLLEAHDATEARYKFAAKLAGDDDQQDAA